MSDVPTSSGDGGTGAAGPPPYPSSGGAPPPYPQSPPPGYPPPGYPPGGYQPPGYPPPGGYGYPGYGTTPAAGAYAGFGVRLGGWLIDLVILFVFNRIIDFPLDAAKLARVHFHYTTTAHGVTTRHLGNFSVVTELVNLVVVLLYGAILCGSARGQTLGMRAVGVRAVDAAAGGPIGAARGLGRAAFEILLAAVFFLPWVLDMLLPLWDQRHQTLHDKVSRTVVIRTSGGPPT